MYKYKHLEEVYMKKASVLRPDRTVIVKTNNSKYVYLTKEVKYHKGLKRSTPNRGCIGKLDDKGMLIPNDKYFELSENIF